MAEQKTRPTTVPVDDVLAQIDDPAREADCRRLAALMADVAGAEAQMWGASMVGFGRYAYRYASGHSGEWPLLAFAARKRDITLYLWPGALEDEERLARLGRHKRGKGCVYVRRLEEIDEAVLRTLLEDSVAALAEQRVEPAGPGAE